MKKIYTLIFVSLLIGEIRAQFIISSVTTNVSCNGGANGSASLTVTGGTPSYSYIWSPGGQTTASISNLSAGTYTFTVTDANSNDTTASVTITEPQPINISLTPINPSDSNLCDGSISSVVSGGTSPYTYVWLSGGETTTSINGKCAGEYSLQVADLYGCIKSDTVSLMSLTTGTTEPSQFLINLTIFPNPSTSTFNIQLPVQHNFALSLIDITGRTVYTNKNGTGTIIIDVSGFSPGIYFVKATNEYIVLTSKLIKE
jgi:hypothetical protein